MLQALDELILLYEEKLVALETYNRGLRQKLFNQSVRFKRSDGSSYPEWEECQFEDIFNLLQTNTFSRSLLNETHGQVFNIHYGDVLIKYGTIIDVSEDSIPFINEDVDLNKFREDSYIQEGDIILADTAEDYSAGKVSEVKNIGDKKILSGLHTMLCRPKRRFAAMYLGYYMNCEQYHAQIMRLLVGTKVYSINKTDIQQTTIKIPCIQEQQKIADVLSYFDELIQNTKEKTKALKTLKYGLLQHVFN